MIDINTCELVPQAYLELWHCNSTGVYSGVVANSNGDSTDATNLDASWLRGVQQSDEEGVMVSQTVFPGRATHIYVLSHLNATLNAHDTLTGGAVTHVGQMFFDQGLISLVETEEPYVSNTQELTVNADDNILAEEAADVDSFIEYALLGDDIPEVYWTEDGGVENPNSEGGGPGGAPSGSRPSGTRGPTGAVPSSTSLSI